MPVVGKKQIWKWLKELREQELAATDEVELRIVREKIKMLAAIFPAEVTL